MLFRNKFSLLCVLVPFGAIGLASALPSYDSPALATRQILDLPGILTPILSDLVSGKILGDLVSYLRLHPDISSNFPGLAASLQKTQDGDLTSEEFYRALLRAIQLHPTFNAAYNELDPGLQTNVAAFLSGDSAASIIGKREFYIPPSPAAKQHFKRMAEAGTTPISRRWLNIKREITPVVYEDDIKSKPMTAHVSAEFHNWGLTVSNVPAYTFVPTTVKGLENLIQWAKAQGKRVRAAGFRHTWTDMFSETGEIFVSMLDLVTATSIPSDPFPAASSNSNTQNEFKQIELETADVPGSMGKKRLARIGAAVTNEEFRRWAVANNAWTMPFNIIIVEITYGGSNAPICHGGGIRHKTISDLVRRVEYVDANGVHQSVDDPALLKAAAGAFGLLGVVTHITLELDKMTYADMRPLKQAVGLAIPPPPGFTVPAAIRKTYTAAQLEAARLDFVNKAEKAYYSEWFWFPYQPESFVNVWNNTDDFSGVIDYPTTPDQFLQWIQGWIGGVLNDDPLFRAFPGYWQAAILSTAAMLSLPPNGPVNSSIKTYLIDALHFRRGVQNMRVRDMELHIPVPPMKDDPTKGDWSIIQRAWWDAITIIYSDPKAPMRIALEMRIAGDSDIIMAPQTKNKFGTATIEVLTTMAAADDGTWDPFVQRIADKWMSYKDADGKLINTRPHWAKEWDTMTVHGVDWKTYLKDVSYKDEIPQFTKVLEQIGATQGWTLEDLKKRFSCPLLDFLFF